MTWQVHQESIRTSTTAAPAARALAHNAAVILMALADVGPASSMQLGNQLGLRKTAVYKHLLELRSEGYIEGFPGPRPANGRPGFLFRITPKGSQVLGSTSESDTRHGHHIDDQGHDAQHIRERSTAHELVDNQVNLEESRK